MSDEPDLYQELLHLRSRRGLERPHLGEDIGPWIRTLSGVGPSDRESRIRQRVESFLRRLVDGLPPDLNQAARLAFALDKDHRYPTLEDRVGLLAEQQNCSARTARRLMDRALQAMVNRVDGDPAEETGTGPGWRVTSLRALYRLDTSTPELYEMRTIVATRDISEVVVRVGLPPGPDGSRGDGLHVDALFGARVATVEHQPGRNHYRVVLKLARTVPADERHEFWLRVVLPPGQPTWPHYAIVPLNPCDFGTVRVRFSPSRLPSTVWLLDEVPYLDLNDRTPGTERLEPDDNGDIARDFRGLREGYGYGVAWVP